MDAVTSNPDQLIATYLAMRKDKELADKTYEAWREEQFVAPMRAIESSLLNTLNVLGSDSLKSKAGTAMKVRTSSLTTFDSSVFRRHVIGLEAWELVDWRPNKTAVDDLVKKGEDVPPGLKREPIVNCRIRKASSKGEE